MRQFRWCGLALALMLGCTVAGCSDKQAPPAPKSAVRQMTDDTAHRAVQQIRTPIEKARAAAQLQEGRSAGLDDAAKSP